MRLTELPYRDDSADLFDSLADEPWAVFLDSGPPKGRRGRWDILAARPHVTLVTRGGFTRIHDRSGVREADQDPLALLRGHMGVVAEASDLPFPGGAIGYFGYGLAGCLAGPPMAAKHDPELPDMALGLYDWAVVVDHLRRRTCLVGAGRDAETDRQWNDLVARLSEPELREPLPWRVVLEPESDLPWPAYQEAFRRVQAYISAGDCYQVNLTQRFSATVDGSRWALYRALRAINPAPFGAYLNHPDGQMLSTSPERFVELRAGLATTRPIKGTRPRRDVPADDTAEAVELAASLKDRAENLMIVDLLRNDLGKVCSTGSVAVPGLFEVESYASVHHLVSTVTGQLAPGRDAIDLLRAVFPGGSITGAPKRRAMAIIEELERHARGPYCGAIGYLGFDGGMDTNIAIRTLVGHGERLHFGVGGGIVADSSVAHEYQECLDKAAPMLRLLRRSGVE